MSLMNLAAYFVLFSNFFISIIKIESPYMKVRERHRK